MTGDIFFFLCFFSISQFYFIKRITIRKFFHSMREFHYICCTCTWNHEQFFTALKNYSQSLPLIKWIYVFNHSSIKNNFFFFTLSISFPKRNQVIFNEYSSEIKAKKKIPSKVSISHCNFMVLLFNIYCIHNMTTTTTFFGALVIPFVIN